MDYKDKKILTIGAVEELTELSARQIRYYEERELIQPERTSGGTRKYSILDVEMLIEITRKMKKGKSTFEIKREDNKKELESKAAIRKMLSGQINSHFRNF